MQAKKSVKWQMYKHLISFKYTYTGTKLYLQLMLYDHNHMEQSKKTQLRGYIPCQLR